MLPEALRLADHGLGHDERAQTPQPVRSRLGERFQPWQLEQKPEESWVECELHARAILGEDGFANLMSEIGRTQAPAMRRPEAELPKSPRGDMGPLFGNRN